MPQIKLSKWLFPEITEIPDVVRGNYFNSLDGLRAVSILIVIVGHLNFRWNIKLLDSFLAGGHLGVYIFFVISGFLITTLLLKEKLVSGSISLRQFYIRRTFRIFPVAYLYLLIVILIGSWYNLNITFVALITAVFYLRNFSFEGSWYVNHYWSLSVEEQFYLLFPIFIKWSIRRYTIMILFILGIIIVVRLLTARMVLFSEQRWVLEFLDRGLEGILIGSLFSITMFQNRIPFTFLKKWNSWVNVFLIISILGIHNNVFNTLVIHIVPSFLTDTILYVLISFLILNNLAFTDSLFFKLLNNKTTILLGTMSYSMYIWQQLFTVNEKMVPGSSSLPWYSIPLNLILLLGVSLLSYRYFEQPIRKLRKWFEARNVVQGI